MTPSQLVQQGVDDYQQGAYQAAITAWETALSAYQHTQDISSQAIVLENLARGYQAIGQTSQAITHWEQTIERYRQLDDMQQVGRLLTEASQAYTRLGQYQQAVALLCGSSNPKSCTEGTALQIAQTYTDVMGTVAALGSLGEVQRLMGESEHALVALQAGMDLARSLEDATYLLSTLNSLGSAYTSLAQISYRRASLATHIGNLDQSQQFRQDGLEDDRAALQYLQESIALAKARGDTWRQVQALLNAIPPYYRTEQPDAAKSAAQQVRVLLAQMPNSQDQVYATLDLVRLLQPTSIEQPFSRVQCLDPAVADQAEALLKQAITSAQQIHNLRSQSFGLGELGHLYECQAEYTLALQLTQQAKWAAEQEPDSRYLWEWQTGRIQTAQNQIPAAIDSYERAIATLETIRNDILTAKRDVQFDFRDTIEPVYRQLVQLRLSQGQPQLAMQLPVQQNQNSLQSALSTLDSLKLAELQNYFGDDCVLTALSPVRVDQSAARTATAVFNTVILEDRTAIIVNFPDGNQQLAWINIDRNTLVNQINEYRRELERFADAEFGYNPQRSQQLYDWMVRPFAAHLERTQTKTLVFVQDGILRSIPMAALHDGKQFLIQKYAVATTPSLVLTDLRPLQRHRLRALAIGLTQATVVGNRAFAPLDNVNAEIQAVKSQLPNSKPILNQEFTRMRLQQELNQGNYPIIHIATHGEFGTEADDTFLVTGDSQKLTLNDLDALLRRLGRNQAVELLSLTACQTAAGDDRAALGLAGVAAQAGAKSVLATLWFINDAATAQLVDHFYQSLVAPQITKAEALQLAQQFLIEQGGIYAHPAYWAPFILIGSWL